MGHLLLNHQSIVSQCIQSWPPGYYCGSLCFSVSRRQQTSLQFSPFPSLSAACHLLLPLIWTLLALEFSCFMSARIFAVCSLPDRTICEMIVTAMAVVDLPFNLTICLFQRLIHLQIQTTRMQSVQRQTLVTGHQW